jgi:Type II secretory pathway, prepilin signal peptidase PulO and related peptidases
VNWLAGIEAGLGGAIAGWVGRSPLEHWMETLQQQATWLGSPGVWVINWRRYSLWLLPLLGATLSAMTVLMAPLTGFALLSFLIFEWGLLILVLIDLELQLLPDRITWPLLVMGVLGSWIGWTGVSVMESLAGVVLGYGLLAGVGWLFQCLSGRSGLGGGDGKLLAALGAWLGVSVIPGILFWGAVLGGGAGLLLRRHGAEGYPFGPFLVLGGAIMVWWDFLGRSQ